MPCLRRAGLRHMALLLNAVQQAEKLHSHDAILRHAVHDDWCVCDWIQMEFCLTRALTRKVPR